MREKNFTYFVFALADLVTDIAQMLCIAKQDNNNNNNKSIQMKRKCCYMRQQRMTRLREILHLNKQLFHFIPR